MKFNVTVEDAGGKDLTIETEDMEHAFMLFKFAVACGQDVVMDALQDETKQEEEEKFYYTHSTYGTRYVTSKKRCTCLEYLYGLKSHCTHMDALTGPYSHAYTSDATRADYEAALATKRSSDRY